MGRWMHIGSNATPDTIAGSALKLWVKADSLSLSDGDPVGTWADQSGNGYDLTEATNKPTYKANIKNGRPVVRFDGVNDVLKTAGNISNVISRTAFDIFVVINVTSDPSTNSTGGAAYQNPAIWCEYTGGNVSATVRNNGAGDPIAMFQIWGAPSQVEHAAVALNTWKIYQFRVESGSIYISSNNGSETSTTFTSFSADTSPFAIGHMNTQPYLGADYAEIIVCNSALDSTKRAQMFSYLNFRWAVY